MGTAGPQPRAPDLSGPAVPAEISDSDILSSILSGIISDIYFDILSGSISDIYSDILSGILADIWSDILSVILPDICSDILSGILADIYSDILSGILADMVWHSIWHSIWQSLAAVRVQARPRASRSQYTACGSRRIRFGPSLIRFGSRPGPQPPQLAA